MKSYGISQIMLKLEKKTTMATVFKENMASKNDGSGNTRFLTETKLEILAIFLVNNRLNCVTTAAAAKKMPKIVTLVMFCLFKTKQASEF